MEREISHSMSVENDPVFQVFTPLCLACKNFLYEQDKCKSYNEIPKKYLYAKEYNCPKRDIDINSYYYKEIKDKL